jgi:23S rRNA pseudouridine1911/1915/1917 synthase
MGLIQMQPVTKFKLLLEGNIFVNGHSKSNYKVKAFDVVRVMLTHPPLKIILSGEYSIGYCL